MRFQLVFQFKANTIEDFDRLTAIEESIYQYLHKSGKAKLDGHDVGRGEFNIFIHCNDPELAFADLANFISQFSPELVFSAAYRALLGEEYIVLFPPSLDSFRIS